MRIHVERLEDFEFGANDYVTDLYYDTKKKKWIISSYQVDTVQYDDLRFDVIGTSNEDEKEFDTLFDALVWFYKPFSAQEDEINEMIERYELIKDIKVRLKQLEKLRYNVFFAINKVVFESDELDKISFWYNDELKDLKEAIYKKEWKRIKFDDIKDLIIDNELEDYLRECKLWKTEHNKALVIYCKRF